MNVNATLLAIGTQMSIPVYPDVFVEDGEIPAKYIEFNYADERPMLRGGGDDIAERVTIQVHLFVQGNPMTDKETLKNKLRENGFFINNVYQTFETDTHYTHVCVSCWTWGTVNLQ